MAANETDCEVSTRPPIQPYRYPLWLIAFSVATITAFFYSLVLIPPFLGGYIHLQRASSARGAGDPEAAETQLLQVLQIFPTSKAARIDLAVMLLADPSEDEQTRGLDYLKGMTFPHRNSDVSGRYRA
jgi:hypothetical protein